MQKPSGVVLAAKLTVQLVGAKALLAGSADCEGYGPLSEFGGSAP